MVDFKEKTNPLMVAVIAIYLAAELLCPPSISRADGSMRAGQGRGQGKRATSVKWSGARSAPPGLFDRRLQLSGALYEMF